MDLTTPIESLFMIGPVFSKRLKKIGIKTVEDLLYYFPFRYFDYSLVSPVALVQLGETVTIQGEVVEMKNIYTKYGKKIQKALVKDKSGALSIVWYNQPFLVRTIRVGERYSFSGKVDWFDRRPALISPEYEPLKSPSTIHTGRLVPVYHETYGLSSKWLRGKINSVLTQLVSSTTDFLPEELREKHQLIDLATAFPWFHFPKKLSQSREAKKRFAFEELFLIQLKSFIRKSSWQKQKATFKLPIGQENLQRFIKSLPFTLTDSQKKSLGQILSDLASNRPMNRLLQGDVGSGKTVVAAGAIYAAYINGVQSALMAPTEILANQHYQTLNQLLSPLGVKISLITGSGGSSEVKPVEGFHPPRGETPSNLIIGTHALLYRRVNFEKLGLVIIDEQHRFGVEQRGKLVAKGHAPHVLTMTATPIPRTIALTLYGDLDLSTITDLIPGRRQIKTWVVPNQKRPAAYEWIRKKIKNTGQGAFIICPLIEESETLSTVKAATAEFERLKKDIFPDLRLGLLHGRLKSKEKDEIIGKFRGGELEILIATPVVEVGIDIPQATIMVIEAADRFGLAQLHQLRGRVGRSDKESYCLLFTEMSGGKPIRRLKAMEKVYVGRELAELDLKMRGPGEIYGVSQHGFFDLKVASFSDLPLIEATKQAAYQVFSHLDRYPLLQAKLEKDTMVSVEPN